MNGCGILISIASLIWFTMLFIAGAMVEFSGTPTVLTLLIAFVLANLLVGIEFWLFLKLVNRMP